MRDCSSASVAVGFAVFAAGVGDALGETSGEGDGIAAGTGEGEGLAAGVGDGTGVGVGDAVALRSLCGCCWAHPIVTAG